MRMGYILSAGFLMAACAAPERAPLPPPPEPVRAALPAPAPAPEPQSAPRPSPPPPQPAPGPEGEPQILDIPPLDEDDIPEPGGEGTNVEEVAAPPEEETPEEAAPDAEAPVVEAPDSEAPDPEGSAGPRIVEDGAEPESGGTGDADDDSSDGPATLPQPDPGSEPADDDVISEGAAL